MADIETNRNYEEIERPYDEILERSGSSVGDGAEQGLGSNGNTETQPVKSDGAMGDVWIKSFIRSENWKPKTQGFNIDGQTGYAEFTNVYVSGNIQALTGSVGGFNLGSDFMRDSQDTFGLSSTVTGNNDVRLWAGSSFADRDTAPFRVYEDGSIAGTGLTITQIDLPDLTTPASFHVDTEGNTWWGGYRIGTSTASITKNGDATFTSIDITGGVIDGTTTLGGRVASTLASAIDSSGHFADNAFDTANSTILGSFTFGSSGAIQIGSYVNGVSGDVKISPTGILARNSSGSTTFSLNAVTGVATVTGLVVGTNVGQGTAVTSGGVTTIINDTVNTTYLNARNITAAWVSADNITAGTITGSTLRTASSGQRVIVDGVNNDVRFYDGSSVYQGRIVGSNTGSGSIIMSGVNVAAMAIGGNLYLGAFGTSSSIISFKNFEPNSHNTYDIGNDSYLWWRTIFVNRVETYDVIASSLSVGGISITSWSQVGSYISISGYVTTGTTQTISGTKSFSSVINANGGVYVPGGYSITCRGYFFLNGSSSSYIYDNGSSIAIRNSSGGGFTISGSTYYSSLATLKTAIVPTSKGFNALYCMESPEVWFMDFCDEKGKLDPMFEEVTSGPYRYIKCEDSGYQVWGKRKGYEGTRLESKTYQEYLANEKFLNMNKPV